MQEMRAETQNGGSHLLMVRIILRKWVLKQGDVSTPIQYTSVL
jgi:hypothetical protein